MVPLAHIGTRRVDGRRFGVVVLPPCRGGGGRVVCGCRLARGSCRRAPCGGRIGRAGTPAAATGTAGAVGGGAPHCLIYQPGRREGGGFALTP